MKRALYLAGTFAAAVIGESTAETFVKRQKQSSNAQAHLLGVGDESDAAVVPVPPATNSHLLSMHANQQQQLERHQPSPHNHHLFHRSSPPSSKSNNDRQLADGSGTLHNLVLLLRFSDQTSRTLPSQSDISKLYNSATPTKAGANADVAPTGSVRQVYLENSYGKFTIETTVTEWITLPHTEEYYAGGNHGFTMLKEGIIYALDYLESESSFSYAKFDLDKDGNLDGLGVLTSGYGAEFAGTDCYGAQNNYRIWSHKGSGLNWSSQERHNSDPINVNRYYVSSALRGKCGSDIVRMGVICHELGHYLGLPDLYDPSFTGVGIGAFDFMSQSWGFDGTGLYPPYLSAWSKAKVGWANVVEITTDGTYDIEASWKSNVVYKISSGFPEGEYLLIENRQPYGYDEKLPGGVGGLAIWHIDDKAKLQNNAGYPEMAETRTGYFPENSYHYQVALLSADGDYDLEMGTNQGDVGDLWSASSSRTELTPGPNVFPNTDTYQSGIIEPTGIKIFDLSASGEKMTFSVEGIMVNEVVPVPAETEVVSDVVEAAVSQVTTSVTPPPTHESTNAPTTTAPTPKPNPPIPTSNPTKQPTKSPVTPRPTSSPTSEAALCADRCITAIDGTECPINRDLVSLPKCSTDVTVGKLCDADGECGTDPYLNNCAGYDVYRRIDCATVDITSKSDTIEQLALNGGTEDMTNWSDSVTLVSDPAEEASSQITSETLNENVDSPSSSSNVQGCPYYPGTSQGHQYCLNDCKHPDYMRNNAFFEFHTIHECCELHFDDEEACISLTLMAMNAEETSAEVQRTPSVYGMAWYDDDENNRKGRREKGIPGVLIYMYDCPTKEVVDSQLTDSDGKYMFDDISVGSYYLKIDLSSDFALAEYNSRRNGNLDSDFKTSDGSTDCFPVQHGGEDIKLDVGLVAAEAQLVSAQQDIPSVSTTQESAVSLQSYVAHTKSRQRTGSIQQQKSPPVLQTKSMLRGSDFAASDSFVVNVKPAADATIQSNQNVASAVNELRVGTEQSGTSDALLRFDLTSLKTHDYRDAKSAVLRLHALIATPSGGLIHMATHNVWDENYVQWANAPAAGNVLASIGNTHPNKWLDVDVTGALALSDNGVFSLRIQSSNRTWLAKYSSKEDSSGSRSPVLQVTF